jgi:cytochrome c553
MRKNILFNLTALLTLIGIFTACSKTSEDQLTATIPVTTCDTVGMKYSANIVPILQANCYSCHGNGSTGGSGGISLDGYANLKLWADNGYLVGNITHASGYVAMPYGGGKLSDCDINKIIAWIHQGEPNN